jgi:hypothetical protein
MWVIIQGCKLGNNMIYIYALAKFVCSLIIQIWTLKGKAKGP